MAARPLSDEEEDVVDEDSAGGRIKYVDRGALQTRSSRPGPLSRPGVDDSARFDRMGVRTGDMQT
jgi:hypothetical protein